MQSRRTLTLTLSLLPICLAVAVVALRQPRRVQRRNGSHRPLAPLDAALLVAARRVLPRQTDTLLRRERRTFGGSVSGSPNKDTRRVRPPLPARSGERIKVRGASDCILTVQARPKANSNARRVLTWARCARNSAEA